MPEESDESIAKPEESQPKSHTVDGLLSVIQPVIYETDLRIVGVRQSQKELNKEIERLIAGTVMQSKRTSDCNLLTNYLYSRFQYRASIIL